MRFSQYVRVALIGALLWVIPFAAIQAATGKTNSNKTVVRKPQMRVHRPAVRTKALNGGPNILLYSDDVLHEDGTTYPDQALQHLGLGYTSYYDDSEGFIDALTDPNEHWDVVLIDNDNSGLSEEGFWDPVIAYIQNGGRVALVTWSTPEGLFEAMGVSYREELNEPLSVYWWNPGHPIFTTPESVPEFTDIHETTYGTDGFKVEPLEGSEAEAGFTESPETDQASIVIGNGGRTIFNGIFITDNLADLDEDELLDGVELWANEIQYLGNFVRFSATLHFEDAFARPGGHTVVDVAVESNQYIAGLQFKIQPYCNGNPSWLVHFNGLINDLESDGWTATSATNEDGVTTILLFHTSGGTLSPGQHHKILELVFDIDPDISFGKWIDLVTWDVVLSDPDSHPIPTDLWQGKIHIGHPGDLAGGQLGGGDGHTDILDVIKLIKKLLGLLPQPEWGTFDFFLCDVNGDGYINILDLVGLINDLLNEQGPDKVIADGPTSPVTVSLGAGQSLADGQLAIPVTLAANGSVAGVQATFTFDAAQLQLGTPQVVGAAAGMSLQSQVVDGTLRVIVYSATGQVIPAGAGPTLLIPVTLLGEGTPELTLSEVLLANRQAQMIPVVMGTGTVKVAPLPAAFALKGARPNPFNPTTRLAYDVPQAAHIVLAVYNLVGQEVIRLVDAEQQPGRYELVWDGRNAQGLSVASGVYLYRLTSSTGFSETKRMTLLK